MSQIIEMVILTSLFTKFSENKLEKAPLSRKVDDDKNSKVNEDQNQILGEQNEVDEGSSSGVDIQSIMVTFKLLD